MARSFPAINSFYRTLRTQSNIFRATTNGTEIQIDFTDGTSFNCLVSNRTEIEANLSLCGAGEPQVLEQYLSK